MKISDFEMLSDMAKTIEQMDERVRALDEARRTGIYRNHILLPMANNGFTRTDSTLFLFTAGDEGVFDRTLEQLAVNSRDYLERLRKIFKSQLDMYRHPGEGPDRKNYPAGEGDRS